MMRDRSAYSLLGRTIVYFNIAVFLYLYCITELLSCFNAISKLNIRIAWIPFVVVVCLCVFINRKKIIPLLSEIFSDEGLSIGHLIAIIVFLVVALIMAFVIIPSNNDSMVYHLPRVMNWIQNRSINYYYTFDMRQLFSQPLAEYAVLNVYLMVGNASCVNLVQWYAYLLFALLIFFTLKKCNVGTFVAMIGSMIGITAPIIIAESVTTQNDLFAGVWTLMYLYIALDFIQCDEVSFSPALLLSLAALGTIAGLALMSKAQGVIPILIISIWLLINRIRKHDKIIMLGLDVLVIGVISLFIAMPYFVRNYNYTGDILAMSYFGSLAISTADPRAIILNTYKNWSMGARSYTNVVINRLLYYIGVGLGWIMRLPIDDPRITNPEYMDNNWGTWFLETASYNMDRATAPIISWLFLFCCGLNIVKKGHNCLNVALKRVLAISIFVSLAYVYWQPWVMRLMVPVYMLMTLFIVLVINEYLINYEASFLVTKILPIVLVFTSVPAIYNNGLRFCKALGEEGGYRAYFEDGGSYWEYSDVVNYVNGIDAANIGMILRAGGYEYPLWVALKNHDNKLIHVDVSGVNMTEIPDCIIKLECGSNNIDDEVVINEATYVCTYLGNDNPEYSVWLKN